MLTRRRSHRNPPSFLVGMHTLHFGRQFICFLQSQTCCYYRIQQSRSLVLTQRNWNLCPRENLHRDIYNSFIHNCQNLETTKMSLSRWMNKQWYFQAVGYYSELKRKSSKAINKTRRNLKGMLLSERRQSEKATYCMIPTIRQSGKVKTMETVKDKRLWGWRWAGRMNRQSTGDF